MAIPEAERAPLVREAFRLEYLTFAWMLIEAAVAIGAGIAARSITLLAFGIDSLIELTSAGVRLSSCGAASLLRSPPNAWQVGSAAHFCLLSRPMLWWRPDGASGREKGKPSRGRAWLLPSWPCRSCGLWHGASCGLLPRLAVVRYAPTRWKATCGWLSFTVVIGLMAQLVLTTWWIDSVTSLVIVGLLVKEGWEAWKAEEDDD